ncbi:hypothetical protein DOM22_05570 [Bdellovibrio sp. ZAP7]|uniref:hypothetical protein n=1 Tax=Bdellovibrio sp. ZAP7 TaxID=2231053 RepID=UPI0011596523|nr:hypothetical protein [Bdellovibrio sp. ZAP7]QDK44667.1 hypothetical protein DOM22_05570 [Bdellovibrio sp. ZAP7]
MKKIILTISILIASKAFSHGEDKPGPNGGFIRMPGAYHTEVVADGNQLKVYLLDINWKNPSTKNSSVEIVLPAVSKSPLKCQSQVTYFSCSLPTNIDLKKKGQLLVNSQREGQKGNQASYELPLKLEKIDDGHGGHH